MQFFSIVSGHSENNVATSGFSNSGQMIKHDSDRGNPNFNGIIAGYPIR